MNPEYLSFALRTLWKRRLRTALTMLGIIIAIATLFVLVSISLGLQSAVKEQFRQLGTDKFFIFPRGQLAGPGSGGAAHLTLEDAEVIDKVGGVKDISYAVVGNAKVEFAGSIRYTQVLGVPPERSDVFTESGAFKVDEGRFLRKGDRNVVSLGSDFKQRSFFPRAVHTGDSITINGRDFRVKTIIQPRGNPGDDRIILMPLGDFQELFSSGERVDQVIVQADDTASIREVAQRVERRLRTARDVTEKTQDFSVVTPEEFLQGFGNVLTILTGFLAGIAAISLIVGSIGIATTMFTAVVERTREIGVMKALGARNRDIALLFTTEAGALGFAGGILGVLAGSAVSTALERIAAQQFGILLVQAVFPAWLIIFSLCFAFLVGVLSGFWPAWRAAHVTPTEALRYE